MQITSLLPVQIALRMFDNSKALVIKSINRITIISTKFKSVSG